MTKPTKKKLKEIAKECRDRRELMDDLRESFIGDSIDIYI